ncbi:MAG: glycosyltransferase family 39 protein [Methanothrix sp.]
MTVSIMEKLAASFIAALSGIFVFLSLKELINRKTALIGTMIFALATNTWTVSSQGLWQHGLVELILALSIYLVLLNEKHRSDKIIISLGILSGLFFLNRPVDIILLIPLLYYILNFKDRRIVYYFGSMALSGGPFLIYNYYYYGNPFGGNSILLSGFSLNSNNIISFAGLLISPSRGLFVYTPILILSVLGYLKTLQIENKNIRYLLMLFGGSILLSLLVYSSFSCWWAGGSYGPRFLTGMLPALAMFLGLYIKDISFNIKTRKNLLKVCIISISLLWSIFAQLVGAFYYPNGNWDGSPSDNGDRLWDYNDTQIGRTFNAGIIYPHNPLNDIRFIMFWSKMGHTDRVALRAHNGQYICAEEGGGHEVVANRNSVGPWEIFDIKYLRDNSVVLLASNRQYVSVEGGGCKIIANSDFVGPREIFGLKDLGNNSVALLASNGQFVSVESEREVVANANSVGSRETFGLQHP